MKPYYFCTKMDDLINDTVYKQGKHIKNTLKNNGFFKKFKKLFHYQNKPDDLMLITNIYDTI